MPTHRFTLQPYAGAGSCHRCPQCLHRNKTFKRYIDTQTGDYLADHVGRCNREEKCGYHFTPRQYFADNPRDLSPVHIKPRPVIPVREKFNHLPVSLVRDSMIQKAYIHNNFITLLADIFGWETALQAAERYHIGTSKHWHGATIFWQVDAKGRVRTGKIMLYHPDTGKRVKQPFNHIAWVHGVVSPKSEVRSQESTATGDFPISPKSEVQSQESVANQGFTISPKSEVRSQESSATQDVGLKTQDYQLKTQDHRLKTQDYQLKTQDYQLKTQDHRLKTQDHRLKTQDYQLKTQDYQLKTQDYQLKTQDYQLKTQDFKLKQCLFGEHLLNQNTGATVAIAESEKTAVMASMMMPGFIWLAAGSLHGLDDYKCQALKNRKVLFFPDVGAFDYWEQRAIALNLKIPSANFTIHNEMELTATLHERTNGADMADRWLAEWAEVRDFKRHKENKKLVIARNSPSRIHFGKAIS